MSLKENIQERISTLRRYEKSFGPFNEVAKAKHEGVIEGLKWVLDNYNEALALISNPKFMPSTANMQATSRMEDYLEELNNQIEVCLTKASAEISCQLNMSCDTTKEIEKLKEISAKMADLI